MKFRLIIILYLLCGLIQSASALEQVKGIFQVSNGEDLVAFARLVNSGKTNIKAVLVSDIDYCEFDEMIGSSSKFPFCGVFEDAITYFLQQSDKNLSPQQSLSFLLGIFKFYTTYNHNKT